MITATIPDVSPMLRQLSSHLQGELAVHRALVEHAEAKGRAVHEGDHRALLAVIARERRPAEQAGRLRQSREQLQRGIAAAAGLRDVRLSALLPLADAVLRAELERIRVALRDVLERLREINDRNMILIRHGLSFVRDVLNAAVGADDPNRDAYDRRALGGDAPLSGRMVDLKG